MTTKVEETKDTSAQEAGEELESKAVGVTDEAGDDGELEVDLDRIAAGDEDYQEEVNRKLAERREAQAGKEQAVEETVEGEPKAPAPKTPAPEVDDFEDEIVYRGKPEKVKGRAAARALMQKGRHLEVTLEELAPLRKLHARYPEVFEALADPNRASKVIEAMRGTPRADAGTAPEEDLVREVQALLGDNHDPEDVANVTKVVTHILDSRDKKAKDEREKAQADFARTIEAEAQSELDQIRSEDPEAFAANQPLMIEALAELERTLPTMKYRAYRAAVLNPREKDPETGESYFRGLYRAVDEQRRASAAEAGREAAAAKPKKTPAPAGREPSARLEPGAASASRGAPDVGDAWGKPKSEFDRLMDEAKRNAED